MEKEVLAIPGVLLDTVTQTVVSEFQTVCATCGSSGAERVLQLNSRGSRTQYCGEGGYSGIQFWSSSRVVCSCYYTILSMISLCSNKNELTRIFLLNQQQRLNSRQQCAMYDHITSFVATGVYILYICMYVASVICPKLRFKFTFLDIETRVTIDDRNYLLLVQSPCCNT